MGHSQTVWIDLVTGAVGLEGPFLQQYHRPFLALCDLPTDACPQMIVLIGDTSKRLSRQRIFELGNSDDENRVHLHVLKQPVPILVADCELHLLSRMPTVWGGPLPGDRAQHLIRNVSRDVNLRELALNLYAQILSPFSTLICIFSDDFGGTTEVARLLASWIVNKAPTASDIPEIVRPRVLILKQWDIFKRGSFDEARAYKKFRRKLALHVKVKTHKVDLPVGELDDHIRRHFDSIRLQIFPTYMSEGEAVSNSWASLRSRLLQDSEEIIEQRVSTRTAFSVAHFQDLFQSACFHFASNTNAPFSFVEASRHSNPVPRDASVHLQQFLEHSMHKKQRKFAVEVVSSALCLNCYPPDMHQFAPTIAYQKLYNHIIAEALSARDLETNSHDLGREIQQRFCDMAESSLANGKDMATVHRSLLAQFKEVWRVFRLDSVCVSCLMEAPQGNTLSCQHAFCNPCVVMLARQMEPWVYHFDSCPLCKLPNSRATRIKPYTAGIRGISIGGERDDIDILAHFLKELQKTLSIHCKSLQEHFDFAMGTGSGGRPLILGIFCKNWSVDDCLKHLKKQRSRHQTRWQKALATGLALAVKAGIDRRSPLFNSSDRVTVPSENVLSQMNRKLEGLGLHVHTKALSPTLTDNPLLKSESVAVDCPDIMISCEPMERRICTRDGKRWSTALTPDDRTMMVMMADSLLASLFYIELVHEPLFHSSRIICELQMRCRLPSGPFLSDLVARLCQPPRRTRSDARLCDLSERANVYYGGNGQVHAIAAIDDRLWNEIRAGGSFIKYLNVEVFSLDSMIEVRIDSIIGDERPFISNCPYRLGKLVKDQGMDCKFGHRDHQSRLTTRSGNVHLQRRRILPRFQEIENSHFSDDSEGDDGTLVDSDEERL